MENGYADCSIRIDYKVRQCVSSHDDGKANKTRMVPNGSCVKRDQELTIGVKEWGIEFHLERG